MNKKVFLPVFLILLVLPFLLQAQSITSRKAAKIASKYIDRVVGKPQTRGGGADKESYYIFNDGDGDGFVIVAGDGRMNEVVGYSKTGRVSSATMPPALRVYLADYDRYVQALGTAQVQYKATAVKQAVKPLLKTKWNQYSPYNNKAPELNGRKPPIGCVAAAVSQVMNYHRWPNRGKGQVGYTPMYSERGQSYGRQYVNFEESVYQWNKMTRDCKEPEAAEAVAKLMYDVSVGVRMDFKPDGSGARMENAVAALNEYFDYTADLIQRDYMSSLSFMEILRNELRDGFPVVFSGYPDPPGVGHAWVCDGFDERGLFSMNWGWGGASDGYFDLSYLNPYERGAGGSGIGGYVRSQDFIRVHPNKPGSKGLKPIRMAFDFREDGYMCPDKEETTRQQGFEIRLENLGNGSSHKEFKSRIGVGIFKHLDENAVEIIDFGDNYTNIALPFGSCFYEVKKNVTFDKLHDGMYYIHPMTKTIGQDEDWYKTGRPCYIKIEVKGDKVTVIERTDKPALQVVSVPTGAAEVPSGSSAEYSVRIANASTKSFKGTLKVVLKGQGKQYTYQPINPNYRFMDNTEETRDINVSFADDMETGEYELNFVFEYVDGSNQTVNLELAQPAQPLKVKVWNTSKNAYLNYMGTYVTNGFVPISGEKLNVEQHLDMQVFVKAINMGKRDFNGELRYMLEDVESKERLNLLTHSYAFAQGAGNPTTLPIVYMKDHLDKMEAGRSYRIVAEVYSGGKREYEWVYDQQVLARGISTAVSKPYAVEGYVATYQRDNSMLNIDTNKPLTSLDVYTSGGSLVFTRRHLSAGHHEVSLSRLGAGVYIVVSRYAGGRKVMRIAK